MLLADKSDVLCLHKICREH